MSKTTLFGDWPLLERLTNNEFVEILQYLSLEQYVLTEVFVPKKKWIPLLDLNLQTLQAKCGVCNKQVRFEDIKSHLVLNGHLMLLRSTVKQFYHPFYTYGKIDIKLARGEDVSSERRENALREVNMQIKCFKKECSFAKKFSEIADRRSQGIEEDQFIEKYLGKSIINPEDIVVTANLPLENISKLQFSTVNNEWQIAVGYKNLTKKSTFHCKICSIYCCGIESLNSHLNGHTHKSRQLELLAIRYEDSSRVNKNCCIQFGNSFSFSIKEFAKKLSRKNVEHNFDSWAAKLPKEIAKKIKALNEHAIKMFACSENDKDKGHSKKGCERTGSFETNDNFGHLGVEYVLKIIKNEKDKDPLFECGLCKFVGDGSKMQRHILLFDHRKKYLDLHYCDTIKKYESLIGHTSYKEYRAVMSEILDKVAIEIEKTHSRSLPYTVSLSEYKNRRKDLIAEVYALLHASQIRGPSFSNVVSKEEIITLKKSAKEFIGSKSFISPEYVLFTIPPKTKTYLNQMSHDPLIRFRAYNAKLNKNRSIRDSRSLSPVRDHAGGSHSEQSVAKAHDHRIRSKSPIHRRATSSLENNDCIFRSVNALNHNIWDIYRREISIAANEIEIAYENYRKNPESHPLYETEWNNFWQRRKKELEHDGYDHRSYNFQPEWVHYFKQRIEVLFGESLHKSQINIRHRLGIPLDAEEDCQRPSEVVNHQSLPYHKGDDGRVDEQIFNFKGNKRQQSPNVGRSDTQNKRIFLEGQEDLKSNKSQMLVPKIDDNHSNVIHVLRLMTALEEHLGSLGEKVMDLLSNALQLEKCYPENNNEFEAKVLTVVNCNLLETAMEKLKGILFAGLLDEKKMSGFSRVITYTANLLKYAEKMGWRQGNNIYDKADFRRIYKAGMVHDHTFEMKSRNDDAVSTLASGKALSDTLIDLAKTPQTIKQQIHTEHLSKEHLNLPDCPPPPNLKEPNTHTKSFAAFKGHISNSGGLASFDTKLSLDNALHSRLIQRDLPFQPEIYQLQRKANSSGNNIYNNSFKNNNETRTNVNSRTKNGANSQSLISKIIPKIGQSNTMNQGVDGGNRNQNWLQWNQMN